MLSVVTFGGVFGHFGLRFPPLGSVKLWTKKRLQKLQPKSNPVYPNALGFILWASCKYMEIFFPYFTLLSYGLNYGCKKCNRNR